MFAINGHAEELSRWLERERDWPGSRWSWSRSQLLAWIVAGAPRSDRHWVFEPGTHAIVARLRGDDEGRAALASLAAQLVQRLARGESPTGHERLAIEQLLEFASEATLSAITAPLERTDRARTESASARLTTEIADQTRSNTDVTDARWAAWIATLIAWAIARRGGSAWACRPRERGR